MQGVEYTRHLPEIQKLPCLPFDHGCDPSHTPPPPLPTVWRLPPLVASSRRPFFPPSLLLLLSLSSLLPEII